MAAPEILGLLGLVVLAGVIAARLGRRSGWALGLRMAVLALIAMALARPTIGIKDAEETVIFLVDRSASVGPDALAAALEQVDADRTLRSGLVSFAGDATIHGRPNRAWSMPRSLQADGVHSNLTGGLDLAMSLIPEDVPGRIEVFTDGNGADDLDGPLGRARDRGLAIGVHPMDPARTAAGLGLLHLDQAAVAPGATLSGSLTVHGGASGFSGVLPIAIAGEPMAEVPVSVAAHTTETVPFEVSLPPGLDPGATALSATLGQQVLHASFGLTQPPRVWIVGDADRDTAHLAAVLEAEQLSVRQVSSADAAPPLDGADLIVLVDTPSREGTGRPALSPAFLDALEPFVAAGGGLLTLGGEHAYELGGWHESSLASLLPVQLDPDGSLKEDAVSLIIVLDKSGSMARAAGTLRGGSAMMGSVTARFRGGRPEGSKIRLASEGAIAALERLRDTDQLGVLAVDSEAHWFVPLAPAAGRASKVQKISSIAAGGGGMFVVTGLQAARKAILAADTPLRHVILFADTGDAGEKEAAPSPDGGAPETAFGIAAGLAAEDVTLSVIGIGARDARDTEFLETLARYGGGRFQRTQDPEDIPALFSQETEELLGTGIEETGPVQLRLERWHSVIEGLDLGQAPPLLGHNITHRRPQARVVLASDKGAPLLAIWRVGLGEVVSFTSDASSRWAARWLEWPGFARMWTQLARHLVPPGAASDLSIEVTPDGAASRVLVERRDADGLSAPTSGLQVFAVGEERIGIPVELTEPGQWVGTWRPEPGTFWTLEARDRDGNRLGGQAVAVPPSGEWAHREVDAARLAKLAQDPDSRSAPRRGWPVWPLLLALAAVLLVADAFARRRSVESRGVVGSRDAGTNRGARAVGGVWGQRRSA